MRGAQIAKNFEKRIWMSSKERLRRSRRSSALKKDVKYDYDEDSGDEAAEQEQQALMRRQLPCMVRKTVELSETNLMVDSFVGRRVNKYTGDIEFRAKFTDRSYLHLAWLNFEQMQEMVGNGIRERMRMQSYERKLKREGYDALEDVDDLNISTVTIDCIVSHKRARLPTLKEELQPYKAKFPPPLYPRVTGVFLYENYDEGMERFKGLVDKLMADPLSLPFRAPVDLDEVPNYLDYIDTPMDLGTISGRLQRGEYYFGASVHYMIATDVRLVFQNCQKFNQEGSEIWQTAKDLSEIFEKLYYNWIISPAAWISTLKKWSPWTLGCSFCGVYDESNDVILCDHCDGEYHLKCITPKLKEVPSGEWFCSECQKQVEFRTASEKQRQEEFPTTTQDFPRAVWLAPTKRYTDDLLHGSSGAQSTVEDVYLVKWAGLSYRQATWERVCDIGKKELIDRYHRFNKMPSEVEIRKTVCQLPCCAETMTLMGGYGNNTCQKDKFCTLGYCHAGDCTRELQAAESGSKQYTVQRMVEQIRAQMYAYHRIMNNQKLDNHLLKQCGMYSAGYALRRTFLPKEEKAVDEFDIDEEEDVGDADSEDLSDEEEEPPEEANPYERYLWMQRQFQKKQQRQHQSQSTKGDGEAEQQQEEEEEDDDDEEDEDEELSDEDQQVSNIIAGMVEHIALARPLPSLMPLRYHFKTSQIYDVRLRKTPSLGLRLGLRADKSIMVVGFQRLSTGAVGPAESCRTIIPGDVIVAINGRSVVGETFERALSYITNSPDVNVAFTFQTARAIRHVSKFANPRQVVVSKEDLANEYIVYPYPKDREVSPLAVGHDVTADRNGLKKKIPFITRYIQVHGPNGPMQHLHAAVGNNTVDIGEHFRALLPVHVCEALDRARELKEKQALAAADDGETITDGFVPYEKSPTFKGSRVLRPYQVEGLNWITSCYYEKRSCILADEMGLGKTVQVVSFIEHLRTEESIRGPYLIVVPLSTIQHWRREIEDWTDMNVCVYHDIGDAKGKAKDMRMFIRQMEWYYEQRRRGLLKFNILLTTYETLLSDYEVFEEIHWRLMVVDEAHRLKNSNSKALKRMRELHCDRRLLLTGTPLQNNITELWVLLNFLEPSQFDSFDDFHTSFGDLKTQTQVQELQQKIAPYILRRVKEDVEKSIPPKEETIIEVELTTMQKRYYRAIYERNRSYLYKGLTGSGLPSLINIQMQLRKCCNHPFLIKGVSDRELEGIEYDNVEEQMKKTLEASGKFVLVSKLLPKLKREGHKVLIFSQFIHQLDLLQQYCESQGFGCERLDGTVSGHARQSAIDRFSRPHSKSFVFLLSTRAGGVGINLIAADTVIIFDSDWNPQNDLQAQARCHRIGQEKAVKIYRLITRNTFESEMFARASRKLGLEHAILGTASFHKDHLLEDQPSAQELEALLKRGAYGLADDDDSAFRAFAERDIEDILRSNTHVVSQDSSSVDRSSFVACKKDGELSLDDPNFWEKVLPGDISIEMLALKLADGTAVQSRQAKLTFLTKLRTITQGLLDANQSGSVEGSHVADYDMAMQLWQTIAVNKCKEFTAVQRTEATTFLDTLHGSRVRSCRMVTSSSTTPVEEKRTRQPRKRRTSLKTKAERVGKSVDVAEICSLCADGGLLLFCDGPCHRSFHLECVGMAEEPDDDEWFCPDCETGQQMCLKCGEIGSVGGEDGVVQCSEGQCGRFYHRLCLKQDEKVTWVGRKRFKCPQHVCVSCDETTSNDQPLLQCTHCPHAIHSSCQTPDQSIAHLSKTLMICWKHLDKPKLKLARDIQQQKQQDQEPVEEKDQDDDEMECALCANVNRDSHPIEGDIEGEFLPKVYMKQYRVHVNCAVRSPEVYESPDGKTLCNVEKAIKRGKISTCTACRTRGATIGCSVASCRRNYHLRCGVALGGIFTTFEGQDNCFLCKFHRDLAADALSPKREQVMVPAIALPEKTPVRKRRAQYVMNDTTNAEEQEDGEEEQSIKRSKRVRVRVKVNIDNN